MSTCVIQFVLVRGTLRMHSQLQFHWSTGKARFLRHISLLRYKGLQALLITHVNNNMYKCLKSRHPYPSKYVFSITSRLEINLTNFDQVKRKCLGFTGHFGRISKLQISWKNHILRSWECIGEIWTLYRNFNNLVQIMIWVQ